MNGEVKEVIVDDDRGARIYECDRLDCNQVREYAESIKFCYSRPRTRGKEGHLETAGHNLLGPALLTSGPKGPLAYIIPTPQPRINTDRHRFSIALLYFCILTSGTPEPT
jgi:hypothetical protein